MSFTITNTGQNTLGQDLGWRTIRGGGMGGALTVHATEIPALIRALTVTHDQWIDEELLRRDLAREERGFPPPTGLPLAELVDDGAFGWRVRHADGYVGRVMTEEVALRIAGQEVTRGRP